MRPQAAFTQTGKPTLYDRSKGPVDSCRDVTLLDALLNIDCIEISPTLYINRKTHFIISTQNCRRPPSLHPSEAWLFGAQLPLVLGSVLIHVMVILATVSCTVVALHVKDQSSPHESVQGGCSQVETRQDVVPWSIHRQGGPGRDESTARRTGQMASSASVQSANTSRDSPVSKHGHQTDGCRSRTVAL